MILKIFLRKICGKMRYFALFKYLKLVQNFIQKIIFYKTKSKHYKSIWDITETHLDAN